MQYNSLKKGVIVFTVDATMLIWCHVSNFPIWRFIFLVWGQKFPVTSCSQIQNTVSLLPKTVFLLLNLFI